jgi:Flp pilus assembly pilin Flp
MSSRTAEQIRTEMAEERRRLDDEVGALHAESRSLVPILAVGVVALALVTGGKGLKTGLRVIWKLL